MKLDYGAGNTDALLDITTGIVHSYGAESPGLEDPEGGIHATLGGRQYYQSRSGLSGAGYIEPDPKILKVPTLRIGTRTPEAFARVRYDSQPDLGDGVKILALTCDAMHPEVAAVLTKVNDDISGLGRNFMVFVAPGATIWDGYALLSKAVSTLRESGEFPDKEDGWRFWYGVWCHGHLPEWARASMRKVQEEVLNRPLEGAVQESDYQGLLGVVIAPWFSPAEARGVDGYYHAVQRSDGGWTNRGFIGEVSAGIQQVFKWAPWATPITGPGAPAGAFITQRADGGFLLVWEEPNQFTSPLRTGKEVIGALEASKVLQGGAWPIKQKEKPEPKPVTEPEPLADWEKELLNLPE